MIGLKIEFVSVPPSVCGSIPGITRKERLTELVRSCRMIIFSDTKPVISQGTKHVCLGPDNYAVLSIYIDKIECCLDRSGGLILSTEL